MAGQREKKKRSQPRLKDYEVPAYGIAGMPSVGFETERLKKAPMKLWEGLANVVQGIITPGKTVRQVAQEEAEKKKKK